MNAKSDPTKAADLSLKYFYEHHTMILPVTGSAPKIAHN